MAAPIPRTFLPLKTGKTSYFERFRTVALLKKLRGVGSSRCLQSAKQIYMCPAWL